MNVQKINNYFIGDDNDEKYNLIKLIINNKRIYDLYELQDFIKNNNITTTNELTINKFIVMKNINDYEEIFYDDFEQFINDLFKDIENNIIKDEKESNDLIDFQSESSELILKEDNKDLIELPTSDSSEITTNDIIDDEDSSIDEMNKNHYCFIL